MADSNVDVASQALARLGEPAISSFEEDSDTAEKVNRLYEPTILQLLGSHDWRFAQARESLSVDGMAIPVNQWQRAFLLPTLQTDRVGFPLAFYPSTDQGARPTNRYEIEGKWIMTNHTAIVCEYVARKPESQWPGYFLTLAIEALAATLALPVTETQTKEEFHRQMAYGSPSEQGRGGLFGMAVRADYIGTAARSLLDDDDPIGDVRFGGSY